MASYKVQGGKKLKGEIEVFGAKNAVLKQMAATILAPGRHTLDNAPHIRDADSMVEILTQLGATVVRSEAHTLSIDTTKVKDIEPEAELVGHFRSAIVLAAPLLARFGHVTMVKPGGDKIGARPITTHLDAFAQFGADVKENDGRFTLTCPKLKGAKVILKEMSVTATENALMLAVTAKGRSEIRVCAVEPEIEDLIKYLQKMGAEIKGVNTHVLVVDGMEHLNPATHTVIPDRLEAGTFLALGAATKSNITVRNVYPDHLDLVLKKLEESGVHLSIESVNGHLADITLEPTEHLKPFNIDTRPYPGFPTDLQAQFGAIMTQAEGESNIFETLYEGRLGYLNEFRRMGAAVKYVNSHTGIIRGPRTLRGRRITTLDIRAGATMLIAALAARGVSTIERVELMERGYENLVERLRAIGADIVRIEETE